jgi:hypothetical protein
MLSFAQIIIGLLCAGFVSEGARRKRRMFFSAVSYNALPRLG